MAYTLSNLVSQVQDRLSNASYSQSVIKQFINNTQRDIFNSKYLRFMEATTSYVTTASDDDLTSGSGLPSNFVMPIDLRITSPTNNSGFLTFIDYKDFDQVVPNPDNVGTSVPSYWYEYGGTINLYPTPNSTYTIALRYYKEPTELSSDSDVPEVPSEFQELLVLGALKQGYEKNDDFDEGAVIGMRYDDMLIDLSRRYGTRKMGVSLMKPPRISTQGRSSVI